MAKKKPASSDAPGSTCAHWDTASKAALITFLLEHKSEAGDGMSFKAPTFNKAAIHLIPFTLKGGAKNVASCKNKWAWVCALYQSFCHYTYWLQMKDTYLTVWELMERSGFTWIEQHGANITVESELTWEAYVKVYIMHAAKFSH